MSTGLINQTLKFTL